MNRLFSFIFVLPIIACSQSNPLSDFHLDGITSSGEYAGGQHYSVQGKGDVYIKQDNNKLHVALTSQARIWSHVYLFSQDTISVFHASAALGEIIYVKNGDQWSSRGRFNYTVRDTVYDDVLRAKQDTYLKQKGWVANNNNTGDGKTLEFTFDLTRWDRNNPNGDLRMAFVFMSDIKRPMFYPEGLKDDTLMETLLYGGDPPDGLTFNVQDWMVVK